MKMMGDSDPLLEYRKKEYLGSESEISLASLAAVVELVPASSMVSVAMSILYSVSAPSSAYPASHPPQSLFRRRLLCPHPTGKNEKNEKNLPT